MTGVIETAPSTRVPFSVLVRNCVKHPAIHFRGAHAKFVGSLLSHTWTRCFFTVELLVEHKTLVDWPSETP